MDISQMSAQGFLEVMHVPVRGVERSGGKIGMIVTACFATLSLSWYFLNQKTLPSINFSDETTPGYQRLGETALSREEPEEESTDKLPESPRVNKLDSVREERSIHFTLLESEGTKREEERTPSMEMHEWLHGLPVYDGRHLKILGKAFIPLTGEFSGVSDQPLASCGRSFGREIILLDLENSPLLKSHIKALQDELLEARSSFGGEETLLQVLLAYVRTKIFPGCSKKNVLDEFNDFMKKNLDSCSKITYKGNHRDYLVPIIPIDHFIQADRAVCRQHALVTFCLLDYFTQHPSYKPIFCGVPQHLRGNVYRQGVRRAHSWTTFISALSLKKWHIDSLWNVMVDFSNLTEIGELMGTYGEKAISKQLKRTKATYQHVLKQHPIIKGRQAINRELGQALRDRGWKRTSLIKAIKERCLK